MLTEVSTVKRFIPCFGVCSLSKFCCVNLVLRCPCHARVKTTLVKPSFEHLQYLCITTHHPHALSFLGFELYYLLFTLSIWNLRQHWLRSTGYPVSGGNTMTRDEGFTVVPKWSEEAASLDSFEDRSKYVMGT